MTENITNMQMTSNRNASYHHQHPCTALVSETEAKDVFHLATLQQVLKFPETSCYHLTWIHIKQCCSRLKLPTGYSIKSMNMQIGLCEKLCLTILIYNMLANCLCWSAGIYLFH